MIDEATRAHLHSGCALIIGTVDADGMPHASRGWGCTVVHADPGARTAQLRLIVPADDATLLENLTGTGFISITSADVPTLRSLQLKGRVVRTEPAGDTDLATFEQYCSAFFTDIHETDGEPLDILEGWRPGQVAACVVDVDQLYDQTPGPSAGATVAGAQP